MRLGPVFRYIYIIYPTVRFGATINPTVCFGVVLENNRKSYGTVRCGLRKSVILRCGLVRFPDIVNAKVRFGAVTHHSEWFGGVPRSRFFLRCCSNLRVCRETCTTQLFYLIVSIHNKVHRVSNPYETAVSFGFQAFSRGINEHRCFPAVSLP